MSFSPDGRRVAASFWDEGSVRIFHVRTGRQIAELPPQLVGFPGLTTSFSPDGTRLVVPNFDGPAAVVDSRTGRPLLSVDDPASVDADFSPDGRWLALSGPGPTVRVLDAATGRLVHTATGHRGDVIQADWSPDGNRLASGANDGVAKVWDVGAGGVLTEAISISASENGGGLWVAFGPDGSRLMTGDQGMTAVKVWDVSPQGTAEWGTVSGGGATPSVAFLPDGSGLVVGGAGMGLYDAFDGSSRARFAVNGTTSGVSVGAQAVSALSGRYLTAWDPAGPQLFELEVSPDFARAAWSSDGRHLAVVSGTDPVSIVDRSGTRVATIAQEEGFAAFAVAFSRDGRLLAVSLGPTDRNRPGGGRVVVTDWRRDEEVLRLPETAAALSFSPDGDRLVAAYEFGPPRMWDVRTGRELATLTGHTGSVTDAEFASRGDPVATASSDGTIRLWDERGGLQLVLRGHEGEVTDVSFSPDGAQLASASSDGTVRVWALALDDLVQLARRELTRELTDVECERYPRACA